ncbi:HNH/ENDO VII family nuclease [Butyrivibrio sp. YAB3001]|uniref:HNH/ENDO VII family nuclease n=1 Tax=Butyrivibrio sp. YAB3001 TaxID=1520812 RepID=UPI0008F6797E|nr:HNH/ENDO VII family nuclease [Butyrivibrio sp. YAB3001]SFC55708.1 A nuclease of the HNH/ENDO VII superfamily with conserved LHH [Butyrivibrio sp. YAB3001]
MKKSIALILSMVLVLTGCASPVSESNNEAVNMASEESATIETAVNNVDETVPEETEIHSETATTNAENLSFSGLDDEELLTYVQNKVYSDVVSGLNSDEYFVENVEAIYVSEEYIEELTYNSQSNIFFGYTLDELNNMFQGSRYIFTVDDNGQTVVQEMETFYDDSAQKMLENVAIGSGVILLCVTVSVVSGGLGAPAVSMIFMASAKTGTAFALSSAVLGGAATAITTGYQTSDVEQAFEQGMYAASEGFKWGAISGAIVGGVSEGTALYGAAKQTNFTMNQYAKIQQETGYPLDVIKEFHSMEEYQVFKDANLKSTMVGNKSALVRTDIDLMQVDAKGRTNLERMRQGLAPQDSNGVSYQLHHIGQKKDGTLAILSEAEHDNPALHGFLERTEAHAPGNNWDAERKAFWEAYAAMVG